MSEAPTTDLETFVASARQVVDYLRARTPLTDWSVSRIDVDDQVHLHVSGVDLLQAGDRVPWETTFCRRMINGSARIVPDSHADPDYAVLPAAADIRAYAGVPIVDHDGSLFGTLCGVRAEELQAGEVVDEALLEVFAGLLSSQLRLVRVTASERHAAVLSEALASSDTLTGLMNRRGWGLVVVNAETRVQAFGDHGGVIMIDLDGLKEVNDAAGHQAGDVLLCTAAAALLQAAQPGHAVARLGGDEFVVYAGGTRASELPEAARVYADALAAAGVAASLGTAPVIPGDGGCVERALALADAAMYADKRTRRAGRSAVGG